MFQHLEDRIPDPLSIGQRGCIQFGVVEDGPRQYCVCLEFLPLGRRCLWKSRRKEDMVYEGCPIISTNPLHVNGGEMVV